MTESVGSAAEEAAKLVAAVQDWARARFDSEHLATGSSECQVCPVCQAIAVARQIRPETVEHLINAGASLVAAFTSSVAPASGESPPDGASKVQHIKVREG